MVTGILTLGDKVLFKIWSDRETKGTGRIHAFLPKGMLQIMFRGELYVRHESEVENYL